MNKAELADAMLKGKQAPGVEEYRGNYLSVSEDCDLCSACALGCALIGKYEGDYRAAQAAYAGVWHSEKHDTFPSVFAALLDIPAVLALEVESRHLRHNTVEEIAAWLKS